jgi:alcohol dehydrogenase
VIVTGFDFQLRNRIIFGLGAFAQLGDVAAQLGFTRTLIVADRGVAALGHVAQAASLLDAARISAVSFHDFEANPDTDMVEAGRRYAATHHVDSIVALGGGSSLDCAKGINFVLTNGGSMRDYRGHDKATRPMLPSIGVPTTAGTGSEAQSFAIISDAETHAKMACGDSKAMFRVVILDPALTVTQPASLTAITGIDAISHAVESFVTKKRTPASDLFAREAWRLLDGHFSRVLTVPSDLEARASMLLGSHFAGAAIEQSMLGAAHACANPLTARYGTPHGIAIGVMLPHVIRWNAAVVGERYAELLTTVGVDPTEQPGDVLADRVRERGRRAALPGCLNELSVSEHDLPELAADAARQWTGSFNPRAFDESAALALYNAAMTSE